MILVTGGLGYIGSHTVVELLDNNYDVVIIDNLSNSKIETLDKLKKITGKDIKYYQDDVCDKKALKKIFKENKIDGVIHFAGYKAVGESVSKPLKYYRNNIDSTLSLLEVMEENNCFNIIFSSSATVYGKPKSLPIYEDFPLSTTNPYGTTKLFIENILMPYIVKVATGERPVLSIFGDDYDTIDGTGVRDYIHVVDLANGHVLALKNKNTGVKIYNLGTGKGTSVLELVHAFEKVNNISVNKKISPRRPGDIDACFAACDKAMKELGFKAEKTIDEMCKDAYNFVKKNI